MPPKKATGPVTKKASAPADHPPYKDMIKEAILQLKERNGSSRQAIKKYVLSNNKGIKESNFDTQFNAAIRRGVEAKDFFQPKGPSGPVKLLKKDVAKPSAKTTKATGEKPVKKTTVKKTSAPKKVASTAAKATKPKAVSKPKSTTANSKKPRKTATTSEKPTLSKTKAGRVSKTAKPAAKKSSTTKKSAPKKKTSDTPATAAAE